MRILIIGGGITGSVAALAMRRLGHEVVVAERASRPRDSEGGYISISPNGSRILRQLDLIDQVQAAGEVRSRIVYKNEAGITVTSTAALGTVIHRGAFNEILRDKACDVGADLRFDKRLTMLETEVEDRVTAHFADGSTLRGDVLLGCDGRQSVTRKLVLPEAREPRYMEQIVLSGAAKTDLPSTHDVYTICFGKNASFAFQISDAGHALWSVVMHEAEELGREDLLRMPEGYWSERLRVDYSDAPAPMHELLENAAWMIAYPIYQLPKLSRWYRGRVCLLGDAAHAVSPNLGQGASLAMEDVVVLAQCLEEFPGSPDKVFEAYQRRRKKRVDWVVWNSRLNGWLKSSNGLGSRLIKALFARSIIRYIDRNTKKIYSFELELPPAKEGSR